MALGLTLVGINVLIAAYVVKKSRSARAVSVPWRCRETGNVRYLACYRPAGMRAL